MICIQKIYGFHGINRQNIEKSWYVTPVTEEDERTEEEDGKWKIEQCSVGPETAIRFLNQNIYRLLLRMTWALIIIWWVENSKSHFDFIQTLQLSEILRSILCRWSHVQSSYLRFRKKSSPRRFLILVNIVWILWGWCFGSSCRQRNKSLSGANLQRKNYRINASRERSRWLMVKRW